MYETTRKNIEESYRYVFNVPFNHSVLRYLPDVAYNHGVYGWNFTVFGYAFNGIAFIKSYRNSPRSTFDRDTEKILLDKLEEYILWAERQKENCFEQGWTDWLKTKRAIERYITEGFTVECEKAKRS